MTEAGRAHCRRPNPRPLREGVQQDGHRPIWGHSPPCPTAAQPRYLRYESIMYMDGSAFIHCPMPSITTPRMSSATSRKRCAKTAWNRLVMVSLRELMWRWHRSAVRPERRNALRSRLHQNKSHGNGFAAMPSVPAHHGLFGHCNALVKPTMRPTICPNAAALQTFGSPLLPQMNLEQTVVNPCESPSFCRPAAGAAPSRSPRLKASCTWGWKTGHGSPHLVALLLLFGRQLALRRLARLAQCDHDAREAGHQLRPRQRRAIPERARHRAASRGA